LSSKSSPFYATVINVVFWTVSVLPTVLTIWKIEGRVNRDDESNSSAGKKNGLSHNAVDKGSAVENPSSKVTD
jgi:uncharacterized membrane protein